jgi:hypothetical protein
MACTNELDGFGSGDTYLQQATRLVGADRHEHIVEVEDSDGTPVGMQQISVGQATYGRQLVQEVGRGRERESLQPSTSSEDLSLTQQRQKG